MKPRNQKIKTQKTQKNETQKSRKIKPRNLINPTVIGDDEGWKMRLIEWQRMWRRGRWFLGFVCVIYSPMQWRKGGGEADLTHDLRPTANWLDPQPTASHEHRRPPTPHDDTQPRRAEATHPWSNADLKPLTSICFWVFFFFFSLFLL